MATNQSKAPVLVPDPTLHGLNNSDRATLVVDHTSDAVSHNKDYPNTKSITAKSLARVSILGSLSLFSGFALRAGVQKSGSSISFGKSGNEPIMVAHGRLGYLSLSRSSERHPSALRNELKSSTSRLAWGFPYSVGSFTWSETPGASLQLVKSLTSGGNKGAILNVPANVTTLAGSRPQEAESNALGQPGMGSEGSPRAARQRVTLRLLTSWCDTPWVKMEAIETMIVPTLGTLILVIGENGFTVATSVAGTVASSATIAASFGVAEAEPFEFQTDIERVIEGIDRAIRAVKTGKEGLLTIAPEYAFCSSGVQHELMGPHNSTIYYEAKQFEPCSTLLHVKSSIATTLKVEFHQFWWLLT
ncbi:hypothetical protein Nepgr_020976 [Nepenthes gracilis]|uniref:peptidylprolyl isomerase n=1 Tax=Nepenthes gracilis TaxID=150966 RepID=A0AAD3SXV9_NEPGR|nr:hypothetical protein Nepgr_020976 [Nepenthes gracilis]